MVKYIFEVKIYEWQRFGITPSLSSYKATEAVYSEENNGSEK